MGALLKNYPVDVEIWTYSFNEAEVYNTFQRTLEDRHLLGSIKIITDKNWMDVLGVNEIDAKLPWDINERKDNLFIIAKHFSRAECFVPAIIYLDNVIGINKPVFVPAHDMAVHHFYDEFVEKDPLYKTRMLDIENRAENLARAGSTMFAISDTVRQFQLLKYIRNLSENKTETVYLPVLIPSGIDDRILCEDRLREQYGLYGQYMFYPTQIRPYKNVTILLDAFKKLLDSHIDIELVLTDARSEISEIDNKIKEYHIEDKVRFISNVTEIELYSLYKYSAVVPVPSRFEGGFPLQASEALYMKIPIVLSGIPIVSERIKSLGFTEEDCGLELFDPSNAEELAQKLKKVLEDREGTIKKQQAFRERLLSYTWEDAARQYYRIFFEKEEALNINA